MPKFKKENFIVHNKAGARLELNVDINISADGVFYATLPDYLVVAFGKSDPKITQALNDKGKFKVFAETFDRLRSIIHDGITQHMEPEVEEIPVIRYNIESHVSFAIGEDGEIYPNAGFPGASWPAGIEDKTMFGGHHAATPAIGGYSLTIAAKAEIKRITRYGDNSKVTYERYYKDGYHLGRDNPAELLNSWCSMTLGNNPKEMPYSDKAALFFHNLLLGIAKLNRQIQMATFDQENLLKFIENQSCIGMLEAK